MAAATTSTTTFTTSTTSTAATATISGPPTRFELELEFVQLLSSPNYLAYLAGVGTLQDARFVAYLAYLHAYWTQPAYTRFLSQPASTLRALALLQHPPFRRDILRPEVAEAWARALLEGAQRS